MSGVVAQSQNPAIYCQVFVHETKEVQKTVKRVEKHITLVSSSWPWAWHKYQIYNAPSEEALFSAKQDGFLMTNFHVYSPNRELQFSIVPINLDETACRVLNHQGDELGVFTRKNKFSAEWTIQDTATHETGRVDIIPSFIPSPKYQICFNHEVEGEIDWRARFPHAVINLDYFSKNSVRNDALFLSATLLIAGQRGSGYDGVAA